MSSRSYFGESFHESKKSSSQQISQKVRKPTNLITISAASQHAPKSTVSNMKVSSKLCIVYRYCTWYKWIPSILVLFKFAIRNSAPPVVFYKACNSSSGESKPHCKDNWVNINIFTTIVYYHDTKMDHIFRGQRE